MQRSPQKKWPKKLQLKLPQRKLRRKHRKRCNKLRKTEPVAIRGLGSKIWRLLRLQMVRMLHPILLLKHLP